MSNLKPLIDAVAFVRANPDKYNQNVDSFALSSRCLVSYAATNAGQAENYSYPHLSELAETLGVSYDELNAIYTASYSENALNLADELIAKYTPVKYPVGTRVRHNDSGRIYRVIDSDSGSSRDMTHNLDGSIYSAAISTLDNFYTIIVKDEVTTADFEYVVNMVQGRNPVGRFVFDNEDDARVFAKKLHDGSQSDCIIKLIKQQLAPSAIELDF